MKKNSLFIALATLLFFSGCKKDPNTDNKLHIESNGFGGGSVYKIVLSRKGSTTAFFTGNWRGDNVTVDVDVTKGDLISGYTQLRGTGNIKITYNGTVKFSTSAKGDYMVDSKFDNIDFTVN